ncbi:MAG TPA: deoxyribodipyrimidine photo-lyase [Chitinophagaceae bacterium]|nr:deoxyribodipyrimidine photo-lyase [Chitinophagaceae bacterium]
MKSLPAVNICWFRRDLRTEDNAALYHALKSDKPVLPLFIFDKNILDDLSNKADRRVEFIHAAILEMQEVFTKAGGSLQVYYDQPLQVFKKLLAKYSIEKVFTNTDYEPYAIERDAAVQKLLTEHNASLHSYKDQVIFEKDEIVKSDGKPYTVFTPYSRVWKATLTPFYYKEYPVKKYLKNLFRQSPQPIPSLQDMGFEPVEKPFPSSELDKELIKKYTAQRDYPGIPGTSRLGVHLRFGTISIRRLVAQVKDLNQTFLNELIWRDFYQMILHHFPKVGKGRAFREEYEHIKWRNNESEFKKWCQGMTGYPIVDAGMRELNATGFMHNRVRMITASFLAKHLLIDWRWGEAYFAEKLLDYDLAANNGGWQWAAGSGCDAAPYFRIFSPARQTANFDKKLVYIRKWVPELEELNYPLPIVEHEMARKRCLEVYTKAVKKT